MKSKIRSAVARLCRRLRQRRVLSAGLMMCACFAVFIGWRVVSHVIEERQVIGQWYDTKPSGEVVVLEFNNDHTVTRKQGANQPVTLGNWRLNDARVEIYTPTPFGTLNTGFVSKAQRLWANFRQWGWAGVRSQNFVFQYFTIEPTCEGTKVLDEVLIFGCTDTPIDDERFARTMDEALQRDTVFQDKATAASFAGGPIDMTSVGCPG